MTARKPRESAPLPFRLLRLAYEEARANALENVGGLSTLRDEWAKSLRDVVSYDRGQRAKATRGRKAAVMRPPHDTGILPAYTAGRTSKSGSKIHGFHLRNSIEVRG